MSTIEVNKITPVSGGTTVQVGESGDTINIPAGATIANAGTATGFGVSLANGVDNRVVTASSATALNGEANLTYNGTILGVGGTGDLGTGVHVKTNDTGGTVSGDADELVLEGSAEAGLTILGTNSNRIFFGDASSPAVGWIRYFHNDNHMDFGVNESTAMSIDSSQRLSFGADATSTPRLHYPNNDPQFVTSVGSTSDRNHYAFRNTNGQVGAIRTNGSSTHYETSSDYRLKENEVAISDGITRLKSLKPYKFNFKTDADTTVDGFFAHEVTPVVPEAISGDKDAMAKVYYEEGDTIPEDKKVGDFKEYSTTEIQPQAIDQSKLVPLLTSALQEAITKIETLEAKVAALESA